MCIRDRNVAIVDCDATQRSLFNLRERDMEMVEINKKYMVLLEEQDVYKRQTLLCLPSF